ncbi:MAG TPA: hypothetical protein PLO37_02385 [Candidatus Hydrogenedentes bacterium]|nr:hypothetical protein [Candidatus Hydrogenedentota bacterium]HPG65666.1 hypothetical protein [Candidatus Hydrogenedentota bacterium]
MTSVVAAATASSAAVAARPANATEQTVRDKLWIWTHAAGAHNKEWNLPRPSRMTPAEGAFYLGVPNLLMIRYQSEPAMPFDSYAISFRPLKRVVWSLTGASAETSEEERTHVLDLARRFPNIVGFVMDDFFQGDGRGALAPEQLRELRSQLTVDSVKRDLYVVLYQHQLDLPIQSHLDYCDKVTFWTWKSEDLDALEGNLDRLERVAPKQGKLLGCYLWDYGNRAPMPLDLMKKQCALGRAWMREGRIEGMIFLASNVCDIELETVEFTRDWIASVGDETV